MKKLFCSGDEDSQKEFLKEAKLMISLKHDNVFQLKAISLQPSAILSEFVYFDFQCCKYVTLLKFWTHSKCCQ